MDVFYINLAHSTERNRIFLENVASCRFSNNWRVQRFDAISAASPLVQEMPSPHSAGNKGNYWSHIQCIRQSMEHEDHAFIFEDDGRASFLTEYWVERTIASIEPHAWDVIMTDVCITRAVDMPRFVIAKKKFKEENIVELIPLEGFRSPYAGSSAYIVNRHSKQKLLDLLTVSALQTPYDLMLRYAIYTGKLKGILTAPFLTTVSSIADISDTNLIEPQHKLWNLFRRLVWIGGEGDTELLSDIERISAGLPVEEDVRALTALMNPLLTMQLLW
jgi:GR25 family glycosyltransferase involved in LPS biosynthesis